MTTTFEAPPIYRTTIGKKVLSTLMFWKRDEVLGSAVTEVPFFTGSF